LGNNILSQKTDICKKAQRYKLFLDGQEFSEV